MKYFRHLQQQNIYQAAATLVIVVIIVIERITLVLLEEREKEMELIMVLVATHFRTPQPGPAVRDAICEFQEVFLEKFCHEQEQWCIFRISL